MFLLFFKIFYKYFLYVILIIFASSCSSIKTKTGKQDMDDVLYSKRQQAERKSVNAKEGTILSDLFNLNKRSKKEVYADSRLTINPFLWKASLEILSSTMPIASVDSNSGIIITEWYNLKSKNNERVKISVLVNSIELRADGIKVSIFKQIKNANTWRSSKVNPNIIKNLERKIIRQAGLLANAGS